MRRELQNSLGETASAPLRLFASKPRRHIGPGARLLSLLLALLLLLPCPALADIYRIGLFDFQPSAALTLAYDSNVDGSYPEELDPNYQKDDFYLVPSLTLHALPVRLQPHTTLSLDGTISYEEYLKRNDLDTELYNVSAGFNTVLTYLTLNGTFAAARQTDHDQDDTYKPGGFSRDPYNTIDAALNAQLTLRKFRFTASETYSRETHDLEEFEADSQVETSTTLGAYYDLASWVSLFYTYEHTETEYLDVDNPREIEDNQEFGLSGTIPTKILRRPAVTWSVGGTKEKSNTDEEEAKWEFTYALGVSDTLQLAKYLTLSYNVSWDSEDNADEDEVGFSYGFSLNHVWGPYITQDFSFTREPVDTFGSTEDTDTTTLSYAISIANFFLKGVSANYSVTYEISDPLGSDEPVEYTTTQNVSLSHTRPLSRQLSRTLSYTYQWENSNFHHDGAMQEHTIEYMLNYKF